MPATHSIHTHIRIANTCHQNYFDRMKLPYVRYHVAFRYQMWHFGFSVFDHWSVSKYGGALFPICETGSRVYFIFFFGLSNGTYITYLCSVYGKVSINTYVFVCLRDNLKEKILFFFFFHYNWDVGCARRWCCDKIDKTVFARLLHKYSVPRVPMNNGLAWEISSPRRIENVAHSISLHRIAWALSRLYMIIWYFMLWHKHYSSTIWKWRQKWFTQHCT